MKHDMNKSMKAWLILATVIVMAILATLWATSTFLFVTPPWAHHGLPPFNIPWDIEFFYTAKTVVSTINVTLLVFLLVTYIGIYKKTKSEFTVGLTIFTVVLLLYALTSNPLVQWAFGFRAYGLGPFAMVPDLFTCIALAVLLYLSVKY